eukprot:3249058-Rhodomonas_salina.4
MNGTECTAQTKSSTLDSDQCPSSVSGVQALDTDHVEPVASSEQLSNSCREAVSEFSASEFSGASSPVRNPEAYQRSFREIPARSSSHTRPVRTLSGSESLDSDDDPPSSSEPAAVASSAMRQPTFVPSPSLDPSSASSLTPFVAPRTASSSAALLRSTSWVASPGNSQNTCRATDPRCPRRL